MGWSAPFKQNYYAHLTYPVVRVRSAAVALLTATAGYMQALRATCSRAAPPVPIRSL